MPENNFYDLRFGIGLQMDFSRSYHNNRKNIIKLSFIVCLISLILVGIIAYLSPEKGYEISFYSSTPWIIFVLIGVVIVGGICILCLQVISGDYRRSKVWIGGFLLLLLTRMIILYLPYIRGYSTWMGDNSSHLGIVSEILAKGNIDPQNFYPITHIFLTQMAVITSLPVEFIVNHSTTLLSILYVLAVYLLARVAFDDYKPVILTVAAVACVIYGGYDVYLMPNGWSCLYLPLAIFLIIKSMDAKQNYSFKILALIAIVLYPFFHPFSTLVLIIVLLIFILLKFSYENKGIYHRFIPSGLRLINPQSDSRLDNMPLFLFGIAITIWMLWLLSFRTFNANIRGLVNAILSSETVDVVGAMAEKADKMDFNLLDILILGIKDYGANLLLLATFVIGIYIFIKNVKDFPKAINLLLISLLPITFSLVFLTHMTGLVPGLESIDASRVQPYIILVVPIFSGLFFCYALAKKRSSVAFFCIILLVIPPLLAMFGVIPSPYLNRPTPAITEMDLQGMGWAFQNKDPDLHYGYIMSPPDRFADIILGKAERQKHQDIDRMVSKIPDHFNYPQNSYLGESYTNNSFAVITKFDTLLYDTAYERVGRFHSDDFDRLQADPTVNMLYSNDECTIYLIQAAG